MPDWEGLEGPGSRGMAVDGKGYEAVSVMVRAGGRCGISGVFLAFWRLWKRGGPRVFNGPCSCRWDCARAFLLALISVHWWSGGAGAGGKVGRVRSWGSWFPRFWGGPTEGDGEGVIPSEPLVGDGIGGWWHGVDMGFGSVGTRCGLLVSRVLGRVGAWVAMGFTAVGDG